MHGGIEWRPNPIIVSCICRGVAVRRHWNALELIADSKLGQCTKPPTTTGDYRRGDVAICVVGYQMPSRGDASREYVEPGKEGNAAVPSSCLLEEHGRVKALNGGGRKGK